MPSGFANVLLSVPCAQPPVAPYALVALTTGNVVTLQWNAPTPAPSYLVDVTTCAGGPRRFELEVAGPRPALEAPASPGVYLVQVRARNACGTSPPSNAVVVAVP
jgi:hypothetical protein